jgi:ABC-type polysaccharide/polyol phosphate export permease
MIWNLAVADFKMRDQGTFLGFIWTLMHPLIYFFVLYGLFKNWMGAIPNFPIYLIIGIVQWNFFANATSSSIASIYRGQSFIKSIKFPKEVLVLSSVLSVIFCHLFELVVLVIFISITKKSFSLHFLGLLPVTILATYLIISISFILATIGVYFLDISRIWGIFTSIGLFLTPIFYSLDMLRPDRKKIILLNPMTHIIKSSRDILIDHKFPDFYGILYVIALSTLILIIGYSIFKLKEFDFVEKI